MLTEAEYRQRRWATYGVVELEKELPHFHRAMPESAVISDLERYLDKLRAESHPSPSTYYVKPTRIERCDIGQDLT